MKHSIFYALFGAVWLLGPIADASPLDDKVAALQKAIKAEVAARPKPAEGAPAAGVYDRPGYANPAYVSAALEQLVPQIDNPNMAGNAEQQIMQLLAAFSTDAVQKAGHDLIEEIKSENKARSDADALKINALLKRVADEVPKAKKPEELDVLLVDLQKAQGVRNGGYNPNLDNQALYQELSSAFEFTKLWQSYLSHRVTQQGQLAINDLQNLSQNNYAFGIIPRSSILAELSAMTTPRAAPEVPDAPPAPISPSFDLLKNIKTLDEMEPALDRLAPMRANDQKAQMAYNALSTLVQAYTAVKAGLSTTIALNFGGHNNFGADDGPQVHTELQSKMLLFMFQHYLDSDKGVPLPDETPRAFLNRVIADSISRDDWALLQKALSAQKYLNQNAILGSPSTQWVDSLLSGLNQETAGQYTLAVISYENTLKAPDASLPAKLIGDRLAAIKKDHPKEFEEGLQMVISPPYYRMPPGGSMYSGFPGYPGYPGAPGYQRTPPAADPVLSIPATKTNGPAAVAPAVTPPPSSTPSKTDPTQK